MKIKRSYQTITLSLFLFLNLNYCSLKKEEIKQATIESDSITSWIKSSKNTSYTFAKRKHFLKKAYNTIKSEPIDTLSCRNLSTIAYQYFKLNDSLNYREKNREAYQLALMLNDTATLADTHWNNASYYKEKEYYDSSYYHFNKAYIYFERINQQFFAAKMLYGMSFIKGRYRDYSGSEILIIKAISKFKTLKQNKSLYASYNHLANLQNEIEEYDKALFYHKKAIDYLDKLKNEKNLYEVSLNNIGLVSILKGEYSEALSYFNEILKNDSLKTNNTLRYARVIDNKAYCKLLNNDTVNVREEFYKSLQIRDSLNGRSGIVIVKIHLAEYYNIAKDTVKAIACAKEANTLAKEIKNSRDYLYSLKILSNLDNKNAKYYLEKHIRYKDSLLKIDRKIQNKFTRIAYETDEYIEENKRLAQQKTWISVASFGVLLILALLYFLKIQKSKNEKLLLDTEQQKANEQIYILTLKQHAKLEEEKIKESNRISEELHDGILGELFGVRLGLGFLNIKGDDDTLEQHQFFLKELQEIEKEIRDVSHKLNNNFSRTTINFSSLINQLLENNRKIGDFTYQITISEDINWEQVDEIIKVNLYRILQETLQNIIKHAKARNVLLDLLLEKEKLVLRIIDDGIGFNIKRSKKGIGIKNMKSRIQKLNGILVIHSEIDKGTTIHIKIPLE